jgi:Arc/MetJ-type ribon-helix-helix transcriptional regulator
MMIHLPSDVESSIEAVVHSGRFASVDEAMAEAARLLLRRIEQTQSQPTATVPQASPDPLLGAWRAAGGGREYHAVRPHSSLAYATPQEFSESCDSRKAQQRTK